MSKDDEWTAETLAVAEEANDLVTQIAEVLAGHGPKEQATAIALAMATFLSGVFDPRGAKQTRKARETILRNHTDLVRKLLEDPE